MITPQTRTGSLSKLAAQQGVPWYWVAGKERFTKATLPSDASGSGSYWPVPGRAKVFHRFIQDKGPNGMGAFGYYRKGGRTHAGVDLVGKDGDTIVAIADGTIASFYYFYQGTWALFVDHGSYVVCYGEVAAESLTKYGLKTPYTNTEERRTLVSTKESGSSVKAGQPIAIVGKLRSGGSMLHLEMYSSGKVNKSWGSFPSGAAPSGLLNPTNFLLKLAGTAESQKESTTQIACR